MARLGTFASGSRYNRWSKSGRWEGIFTVLSQDADVEYLMVDGSIVRVHQHGAPKKQLRKRKRWASHEAD